MNPILFLRHLMIAALVLFGCGFAGGQELTTLERCELVPAEWADGDSFAIKTREGTQHTIRLYGADCIEWHVSTQTDARRLREQRRYFGISEWGGSPQASIAAAKELGKTAAEEVREILRQPFAVHTAFADARGDGKYKRIYGFVTTSGGEDLAELLVRRGLARAHGVYRTTAGGLSGADYRALLQDVELQAAKRGAGAWANTDWDLLPAQRQKEREESSELSLATGTPKLEEGMKIDPNTAARDELMLLPGVGEITANRIIEARPFRTLDDMLKVEGIGPKSLTRLGGFLLLP